MSTTVKTDDGRVIELDNAPIKDNDRRWGQGKFRVSIWLSKSEFCQRCFGKMVEQPDKRIGHYGELGEEKWEMTTYKCINPGCGCMVETGRQLP